MNIETWWPKLKSSTQNWLIQNNGDIVSAEVANEITEAGGSVVSKPSGAYLADEVTDWIEAVANGETPTTDG
jgi:hypothetical protein